jgi:hypothetical protein
MYNETLSDSKAKYIQKTPQAEFTTQKADDDQLNPLLQAAPRPPI